MISKRKQDYKVLNHKLKKKKKKKKTSGGKKPEENQVEEWMTDFNTRNRI